MDDIARGTVAALRPLGFEVINLGSDAPVSLLDMARHIEELTGRKASFVHQQAANADVRATWADISRARAILGWKPAVGLPEGLAHTVRWYEENRSWARTLAL